jgi:hypothetical protein
VTNSETMISTTSAMSMRLQAASHALAEVRAVPRFTG